MQLLTTVAAVAALPCALARFTNTTQPAEATTAGALSANATAAQLTGAPAAASTTVAPGESATRTATTNRVIATPVSLSAAIKVNSVNVSVPDRVVVLGGAVAYFPGLCASCGNFRVVFESQSLVKYHVEACSPQERNTVIVRAMGRLRYLGCRGDECSKMIIGEGGTASIAPCVADECSKKLVCHAGQECQLRTCQADCFQVCAGADCKAPAAGSAFPPTPCPTGPAGAKTAAPAKEAHVPGPNRVTGLIAAAVEAKPSVKCVEKPAAGPAKVPAHHESPDEAEGPVAGSHGQHQPALPESEAGSGPAGVAPAHADTSPAHAADVAPAPAADARPAAGQASEPLATGNLPFSPSASNMPVAAGAAGRFVSAHLAWALAVLVLL